MLIIHIAVYLALGVALLGWKLGALPIKMLDDKDSRRYFTLIILICNSFGLIFTLKNNTGILPEDQLRIPKEADLTLQEKYEVSIDQEDPTAITVEIPQKKSDKTEDTGGDTSGEELSLTQQLQEAIIAYNEEFGDEDAYYLPSSFDGHHLTWQRPADHTGTIFAALGLVAAIAILMKKSRDEQDALNRRREELLMDYPSLIMKFTLLIQAGMTVRKAFSKIAADYRRRPGKKRAAYEEILLTCYEMESGISELEAYRRFGERCGQIKYKTFSTMLIQNLQKGSKRMADMLEKESLEAWDERKRKARVLGEAASTKLLLPMIMMMGVVMALIMIPAFLSFYG